MDLPIVIRTFFAIEIPDTIKSLIAELLKSLQKQSRARSIHWVRPENLHITLQFLPAVQWADVNRLLAQTGAAIKGFHCPDLTLGPIQTFPNLRYPRVIVLDVTPHVELMALANLLGRGIQAAGYPIELRPFRGHLTLARLHDPRMGQRLKLDEVVLPVIPPIQVREIIYYRSEPEAPKSKYTLLGRVTLPIDLY